MRIQCLIVWVISTGLVWAQSPMGAVAGLVRDASGAAVPNAQVKLRSATSGLSRTAATSAQGIYGLAALPPGNYEVQVEADGFRSASRDAVVETGLTTTADFDLRVGDQTDSVVADTSTPQIHYESPSVDGVVTRDQIDNVPLNGRSFLELAKLEPGGQSPARTNNNRTLAPVLDAPTGNSGRGTFVTVDGGSIMAIGYTGSALGLSQEAVQEFQVSMVGFDLATGMTNQGAINMVTRSGGNQVHGSVFYFFRDHDLAAYPALARDPHDPDPFFQRRQFGFATGGPVRRDRIFYFGGWERNEQRGVMGTTILAPQFAHFSRITPTPLFGDLLTFRADAKLTNSEALFVRYSHDGSRAFSPDTIPQASAYPSQWHRQVAWADQSLLGSSSVLSPNLVNDFRFAYFFTSSRDEGAESGDCPGCLGLGAPAVTIPQSGLALGNSAVVVDLARQFEIRDGFTWQRGQHRVRFGVDWEYHRGGNTVWQNVPASLTLFSPSQAQAYNLPLPASFTTLNDILELPLQSVTLAVGNPVVSEEGGGTVRRWDTAQLYVQDAWRISTQLTASLGLSWNLDRNLNYDLPKPPLLTAILGASELGPTRKQWANFSPILGLAWAPGSSRRTVLRAGGGIFYDALISPNLDPERALLGPPGLGLQTFSGTSIPNPLPGIAGVPVGTPLNFNGAPTLFTGADLVSVLPQIRNVLLQGLSGSDPHVQEIQISKQASGMGLYPANYQGPGSALETSVGVQHQIARDFVVNADLVYRHFTHLDLGGVGVAGIDLNHYNAAQGPVIPACTTAQFGDPQAICSSGPINVHVAPGRATYRGLLMRAEKRLSGGFQLLVSYAYSRTVGTNAGSGLDLFNWLQNSGPPPTDLTHILSVEAVSQLPWHFQLSMAFSFSSAPPFSAYVGGADFNGDGTQSDLLPGTTVDAFGRTMGRPQLSALATLFNTAYGGRIVNGRTVPRIALPANYSFGDSLQSLDFRLSRLFRFRERWAATLIVEAFNLYNASNLSGYSGDLTNTATFGQPTSRATQIFGSGGPRAFQLAMKINF